MEKRTILRERNHPGSRVEKWVTNRYLVMAHLQMWICVTRRRDRAGEVWSFSTLAKIAGRLTIVCRYYALWHNIRLHYTRMRATQCGTVYL